MTKYSPEKCNKPRKQNISDSKMLYDINHDLRFLYIFKRDDFHLGTIPILRHDSKLHKILGKFSYYLFFNPGTIVTNTDFYINMFHVFAFTYYILVRCVTRVYSMTSVLLRDDIAIPWAVHETCFCCRSCNGRFFFPIFFLNLSVEIENYSKHDVLHE